MNIESTVVYEFKGYVRWFYGYSSKFTNLNSWPLLRSILKCFLNDVSFINSH